MPLTVPDYTPSVDDVATYLRARTIDKTGAQLGTFTDQTRPTDNEVARQIDLALPFVIGMVGSSVAPPCDAGARSLVAIKAAEMIEISYYPEQLTPGGTVAALRALWADALKSTLACIESAGAGGDGADDAGLPTWYFGDGY